MKVEILEMNGWAVKRDREVEGTVEINGVEFYFELETEDGMTSIYINKEHNETWDDRYFVPASLECDEDLDMYGISEEDGEAVYDELLDLVDEGYSIEGWDE